MDMDVVKLVDIDLLEVVSLGILSTVDVKKKEVSLMAIIGIMLLFLYPGLRREELEIRGMMVGGVLIGVSILGNQALGLADSLVLFGLGARYGEIATFEILVFATEIVLIFHIILIAMIRKKKYEYPFLPFLTIAYIMWKL